MKTKIILAALMVVGVLSGKTEKTMNEKRWREFLTTLSKEVC